MAVTALRAGLLACHDCGALARAAAGAASHCPRCGAHVHTRRPDSINRAWAYLVAAFILYWPANLLPIMETRSLFGVQQDTIMSGVVFLWVTGSWPLSAVVFIASVVVPLAKMIALALLLAAAQRRSRWRLLERTRLYRWVEFVGRWSMLDIYVVTLLVALVNIRSLAVVSAGTGAIAFGAVVVLTMLSALSFDPRLTWDAAEDGLD